MSNEIREYEWIKVSERLPKIDEEVEVYNSYNTIQKAKLMKAGFNYCWVPTVWYAEMWHPIPEKKPDFSKLKEKDLVIINEEIAGVFLSFTQEDSTQKNNSLKMGCSFKHNDFMPFMWINIDNIKKITRINIENQTFEEI